MTDLQCPATFVVVGPTHPVPEDGPSVPVAATHAAADRRRGGMLPLDDAPLWEVLHDLADLYRGQRVVVLPGVVEAPLSAPDDLVVVRIDADGATVTR